MDAPPDQPAGMPAAGAGSAAASSAAAAATATTTTKAREDSRTRTGKGKGKSNGGSSNSHVGTRRSRRKQPQRQQRSGVQLQAASSSAAAGNGSASKSRAASATDRDADGLAGSFAKLSFTPATASSREQPRRRARAANAANASPSKTGLSAELNTSTTSTAAGGADSRSIASPDTSTASPPRPSATLTAPAELGTLSDSIAKLKLSLAPGPASPASSSTWTSVPATSTDGKVLAASTAAAPQPAPTLSGSSQARGAPFKFSAGASTTTTTTSSVKQTPAAASGSGSGPGPTPTPTTAAPSSSSGFSAFSLPAISMPSFNFSGFAGFGAGSFFKPKPKPENDPADGDQAADAAASSSSSTPTFTAATSTSTSTSSASSVHSMHAQRTRTRAGRRAHGKAHGRQHRPKGPEPIPPIETLPMELIGSIAHFLPLRAATHLAAANRHLRSMRQEILRNAYTRHLECDVEPALLAEAPADARSLVIGAMERLRSEAEAPTPAQFASLWTWIVRTQLPALLEWFWTEFCQPIRAALMADPEWLSVANHELDQVCARGQVDMLRVLHRAVGLDAAHLRTLNLEPVQTAAIFNKLEIVRYMVEEMGLTAADIRNHRSIIYNTGGNGHLEIFRLFFEKLQLTANDARPPQEHNDVLVEACVHGYLDIVRYLYETLGFTIADARRFNLKSLAVALVTGRVSVVRYLMQTVGLTANDVEQAANPHLYIACREGRVGLIRYLVEDAALPPTLATQLNYHMLNQASHASSHSETLVRLVLRWGGLVPRPQSLPPGAATAIYRALRVACARGQLTLVRFLIQTFGLRAGDLRGGQADTADRDQRGKEELAIEDPEEEDFAYAELVRPQAPADLDGSAGAHARARAHFSRAIVNGPTPLQMACCNGRLAIVRFLVEEAGMTAADARAMYTVRCRSDAEAGYESPGGGGREGKRPYRMPPSHSPSLKLAVCGGHTGVVLYLVHKLDMLDDLNSRFREAIYQAVTDNNESLANFLLASCSWKDGGDGRPAPAAGAAGSAGAAAAAAAPSSSSTSSSTRRTRTSSTRSGSTSGSDWKPPAALEDALGWAVVRGNVSMALLIGRAAGMSAKELTGLRAGVNEIRRSHHSECACSHQGCRNQGRRHGHGDEDEDEWDDEDEEDEWDDEDDEDEDDEWDEEDGDEWDDEEDIDEGEEWDLNELDDEQLAMAIEAGLIVLEDLD